MRQISKSLVMSVCEDAGVKADALVSNYSGRGMAGRTCLGIVGHLDDFAKFLIHLALGGGGSAALANELADNTATDSTGFDTVYYWPNFEIVEN